MAAPTLKHQTSTKIFEHGLVLFVCAAVLFFAPIKTDKISMKSFPRGLSIQTSKREPPRIAFNEIFNPKASPDNRLIPNTPAINLNEKVEQKFIEKTVTLIRSRRLVFQPTLISRDQILQELQQQKRIQDMAQANLTMMAATNEKNTAWVDELPPAQKVRILAAQENAGVLDQDWSPPSWREVLSEQIQEAKTKETSFQRLGQNTTLAASSSFATQAVSSKQGSQPSSAPENVIAGQVVLQQGLGLGDGYIDIRYIKDRVAQASGKIQLPSNRYSIQIPDSSGQIKATLFSKQGQRLGEGKIRVSQVDANKAQTSLITIVPVETNLAFSSYDFDRSVAFTNKVKDYGDRGIKGDTYVASLDIEAKPDEQGVSRIENVVPDSWALARTEAPGYMPALHLITAGLEKRRPLFREKFVKALFSIAKEQQKMSVVEETDSLIWGQAKMDGKPQAGIQVDVEFGEDYRPIYFNQFMIPDPKLKSTSENGYYAILHLPEGFHSLVATRGGQYFSHANVQAESETVFVADLENTLAVEKVEAKVFDAFLGAPERAQLEIQSLTEPLTVDGFAELYLPEVERMSLMKVIPANPKFVSQMQVYSDLGDSLQAPLIEQEWIQRLRTARRITNEPETSVVVGFVSDENFEAYLPHIPNFSAANIIYFDSDGKISEGGKAGGGFVMFNVPAGTHSVVTIAKNTNTVHSQVIPVDIGVVSVLQFHF